MKRLGCIVATVTAFLLATPVVADDLATPDLVDPSTVASPNGKFRAHIDPDTSDGRAGGAYKFYQGKTLLWKKHLPMALSLSEVTDNGELCGTAIVSDSKQGPPSFHIVILDRYGKYRLHRVQKQTSPRYTHRFGPDPSFIATSSEADMFLVDVGTERSVFTSYQLSTGKLMDSPLTKEATFSGKPRGIRFVPGTSLLLTQSVSEEDFYDTPEFALYTPQGKKTWSNKFKLDYDVKDEDSPESFEASVLRNGTAILSVADHGFRLRELKSGLNRRFNLVARNGSYVVIPGDSVKPIKVKLPDASTVEASQLPTLNLASPKRDGLSPIGLIGQFCAIGSDRFAHVNPRNNALLIFDLTGRITKAIPLKQTHQSGWKQIVHAGKDAVVLCTDSGPNGRDTEYWKVDLSSGVTSRLCTLEKFYQNCMASRGDGTFVICGSRFFNSTAADLISVRDLKGNELLKIGDEAGYGGKPEELLNPEGIAVLRDGTIAVLDNVADTVQFFSPKGQYLRTWDLKKLWGVEPSYPTDIREGPNQEILVNDFGDYSALWVMDKSGKVISKPKPKPVSPDFEVDGIVWTSAGLFVSDSRQVYRIGMDGAVLGRIGEPEDPQALREVAACCILADGTILATDRRTGTVHVFSGTGKWLGRRLARSRSHFNYFYLWPHSAFECIVDSDENSATILNRRLQARTIPYRRRRYRDGGRRPDRTWFRGDEVRLFSLSGDYVISDETRRDSFASTCVSGYSRTGRAKYIFYLNIPEDVSLVSVAYDGRNVWMCLNKVAYCFNSKGRALCKVPLKRPGGLALVKGQLYVDAGDKQIDRYVLPARFAAPSQQSR